MTAPGLVRVLMVPAPPSGRICPHRFDETPHRNVRPARRLTFRLAILSDYYDNTFQWTKESNHARTVWTGDRTRGPGSAEGRSPGRGVGGGPARVQHPADEQGLRPASGERCL